MIKETKKTETITRTIKKKYCDVCGASISLGMQCTKAICEGCGRDLCRDCIAKENNSWGDYRVVWCSSCIDVWGKYQPILDKLEKEQDKIGEQARKECKEKIKEK